MGTSETVLRSHWDLQPACFERADLDNNRGRPFLPFHWLKRWILGVAWRLTRACSKSRCVGKGWKLLERRQRGYLTASVCPQPAPVLQEALWMVAPSHPGAILQPPHPLEPPHPRELPLEFRPRFSRHRSLTEDQLGADPAPEAGANPVGYFHLTLCLCILALVWRGLPK